VVRTVLKPPRDHRGTHLVGARARPPETGFYLRVCSSGGGTRTHNLRINSLIQPVPRPFDGCRRVARQYRYGMGGPARRTLAPRIVVLRPRHHPRSPWRRCLEPERRASHARDAGVRPGRGVAGHGNTSPRPCWCQPERRRARAPSGDPPGASALPPEIGRGETGRASRRNPREHSRPRRSVVPSATPQTSSRQASFSARSAEGGREPEQSIPPPRHGSPRRKASLPSRNRTP
jgi:hypothetical protein